MTSQRELLVALVYGVSANVILLVLVGLRKTRINEEYRRKIAHSTMYVFAIPSIFLFHTPWIAIGLAAMLETIITILRITRAFPEISSSSRGSIGDLSIAPALVALWIVGQSRPIFYVLPALIAATADPAAWFFGTRVPLCTFRLFGTTRSGGGSAAFFVVALVMGTAALLICGQTTRVLRVALLIAGAGTTAEALSVRGLDNFTVPVATALVLMAATPAAAGGWG